MLNVSNDERELEVCFRTYIVTKATKSYIINSIICCVVNLILFFVGTFLNALVIYVFWRTPTLRFKISYFMIMVLSLVDILVTTIVHPAFLVMSIAEIIGKSRCAYKAFYHIASIVLSGVSLLTFFFMNIERYLSVFHPIFHRRHVTKLRCLMVCSVFWIPMIIGGVCAYVANYDGQNVIALLCVFVIIGTCYVYVAIFYDARKRRRRLQHIHKKERSGTFVVEHSSHTMSHTNTVATENTDTCTQSENPIEDSKPDNLERPNSLSTINNPDDEKEGTLKRRVSFVHDLQLAKIYLLVMCTNLVLNLPNAIGLAFNRDKLMTIDGWVQSKIWTVTLVLMNSTVNSLIFFWANGRLKKEGRRVSKRIFKR